MVTGRRGRSSSSSFKQCACSCCTLCFLFSQLLHLFCSAPAPHHGMAGGMDGMQDGAMSGMGSGMTEQHNLDGINEMNGSVGQSEMSGSQLPPQEYGQPGDDYFNQLNESMGNVDNFSW
eukprot:GHVT01027935.1.p1 GENE.GHVT01027935.1~~GHVT01027935.1.p1  ORF type:complete len:119 (-),score=15.26 GHVT01027935.1:785-1141(-)